MKNLVTNKVGNFFLNNVNTYLANFAKKKVE